MPSRNLPERASLEFLKKLAKERVLELRTADPAAKLADAHRAIAREYGFSNWRELKAEIDRRRAPHVAEFFGACAAGDLAALRRLLTNDPALVRERNAAGSTGLHHAVRHPGAERLLIEHGADPNARDVGDNASPLHFAAANGVLESVRILLDAGADVDGAGDLHEGEVIGWAARPGNEAVINLLQERGARHHIFSAMALGDLDLVARVAEDNPDSLLRRRSRFETRQTPLHAAVDAPDGLAGKPNDAMLQLLIELGADLEAKDSKGRTPLEIAMLRGDREATRLLKQAGAREPQPSPAADFSKEMASAARSVDKSVPMFLVSDMRATVSWYESIGFAVRDRYEDDGELTFAALTFGKGEFALSPGGNPGPHDVRLWFFTNDIDKIYNPLKQRALSGSETEVRFEEDLYEPFYGGRQFSIRDINGLSLIFWEPSR